MTSEPIKVCLLTHPVGEDENRIESEGTFGWRGDKAFLKFGDMRMTIEPNRLYILNGYALDLDPNRETALDRPTPYGIMKFTVRTRILEVSPDRRKVSALYDLYTNGQAVQRVRLSLTVSEEKK